jgi:hypothetical protein
MSKEYFARNRKVVKVGDSFAMTFPKDELRERGLLNDEDELIEDVEGRPYIDDEEGVIGGEIPVDS